MGLAILLSLMPRLCPQTLPPSLFRPFVGEKGVVETVVFSSASLLGILDAVSLHLQP